MAHMLRTFLAIDTPPEFKIQAEDVHKELDTVNPPVRWESAYKLHLTLKFLGDTGIDILDDLESALRETIEKHRPFWLRYSGLGCFPNPKRPRVIWIGCTPLSSDLEHLHKEIDSVCEKFGFDRENRTFHPHITIGRVKIRSEKEKRAIPDLIKKMENVTFDPLENEVHSVLLMKSELKPGGSVYSILKQFSLTS